MNEKMKTVEIALEEIQSRGVEVHLRSLGGLLSESLQTKRLATAWVHRYVSTIAREDHGYGSVTEMTTDWLSALEELLENGS